MKRLLKIAAAAAALLLVFLLLLGGLAMDAMHPEPAAPEVRVSSARTSAPSAAEDTGEEREEVRLYGRILDDETGQRIHGARIQLNGRVLLSEDGRYEIWMSSTVNHDSLVASAPGYGVDWFNLGRDRYSESEIEHDFRLTPTDLVTVFCAGLPDDDCGEMLLTCTHPLLPYGGECDRTDGVMVCDCPEGEAAVRGGGRSTLIAEDAVEAWLDFRDTGRIIGRVVSDGEPVEQCFLALMRVPMGLEDLPRGLVVGRQATCEADGTFVVEGSVSGDWQLMARTWQDGVSVERTLTARRLAPGGVLDFGDIEIWSGGGINGLLIDGVTGLPQGGVVVALREGSAEERRTPSPCETSFDGEFTCRGLPPGEWRVFSPLSPHEATWVTVEDGVITDGVQVFTGDATALDVNGFTLGPGLVVEEVFAGSPADDAGLRPGDVVVSAELAGFPLEGFGNGETEVVRLILGNWDGPGVTLIVDREGEEVPIPLTW